VAEPAEAAAVSALAAETAAVAAKAAKTTMCTAAALATAESTIASLAASASATALTIAAFAPSAAAIASASSVSAESTSVSPRCGICVHQHVQLQQLRLGEWLGHLLLAAEQPRVRRRRAWVAVLVLLPRHRLQRLRRRCASCLFPSVTAVAPTTVPKFSATALPPTTAFAFPATILVANAAIFATTAAT